MVAFLASDLTGFITGLFVPVCGGNVMPCIQEGENSADRCTMAAKHQGSTARSGGPAVATPPRLPRVDKSNRMLGWRGRVGCSQGGHNAPALPTTFYQTHRALLAAKT